MRALHTLIPLTLLISGCTASTPPSISLTHALSAVEKDFTNSHTLPIDHYTTWQADSRAKFQNSVVEAQCQQRSSDPLIPTFINPITLNLTGSFTASGNFQISTTALALPGIGLNGNDAHTKAQSVSVAVSIAPLSSLPDIEEQVAVNRAGALLAQNDRNRDAVSQAIISEKTAFSSYIQTLIQGWSPALCESVPDKNTPLYVGVKHNT